MGELGHEAGSSPLAARLWLLPKIHRFTKICRKNNIRAEILKVSMALNFSNSTANTVLDEIKL